MFKVRTKSNPTAISLASCSSVKFASMLRPICFRSYSCRCSSVHRPSSECCDGTLQCLYVFTNSRKLFEMGIPSFMSGTLVFLSCIVIQLDFFLFGTFHCRRSNLSLLLWSCCCQASDELNGIQLIPFIFTHSLLSISLVIDPLP